jgi:tellurite resistance protein TehA-like permease
VVIVPFLLFTLHEVRQEETLANWLIPVVPPIVAAALGMNLLPYWQPSVAGAMATVLVAMFGTTFFLFIMVSVLVYARLVYHPRLTGETSPTLWIEIGPIGMSMAVFSNFGPDASHLLHLPSTLFAATGIFAAIAMWGVGLWWIAIALLHTLLHMTGEKEGLKFHLGWWSYVFPIGSYTTGTYALARSLHSPLFTGASFIEFTAVWVFFAIVALRTTAGIINGQLLRPHKHVPGSATAWKSEKRDVDLSV